MAKIIKAFKLANITDPTRCVSVPVTAFYAMNDVSEATTPDGKMVLGVMKKVNDLSNPDLEIAMLLGRVDTGNKVVSGPEVFFWRDKCWLRAVDQLKNVYYRGKAYAFYEVTVTNFDELFDNANNPFIEMMKGEQDG